MKSGEPELGKTLIAEVVAGSQRESFEVDTKRLCRVEVSRQYHTRKLETGPSS